MEAANKYSGYEVKLVDAITVPASSAEVSLTLVYWKDENLVIKVSCLAQYRIESDIQIVQFKVDGEDITDLVRREERK